VTGPVQPCVPFRAQGVIAAVRPIIVGCSLPAQTYDMMPGARSIANGWPVALFVLENRIGRTMHPGVGVGPSYKSPSNIAVQSIRFLSCKKREWPWGVTGSRIRRSAEAI